MGILEFLVPKPKKETRPAPLEQLPLSGEAPDNKKYWELVFILSGLDDVDAYHWNNMYESIYRRLMKENEEFPRLVQRYFDSNENDSDALERIRSLLAEAKRTEAPLTTH